MHLVSESISRPVWFQFAAQWSLESGAWPLCYFMEDNFVSNEYWAVWSTLSVGNIIGILSFWKDRAGQIVSIQGLHCLTFHLHVLEALRYGKLQHDKINIMSVCPAKTQISLGIHPDWSEFSLSTWRKLGSLATQWAHSEDWSDWADAQADLSLRWAHSFCWFCHVAAHIFSSSNFRIITAFFFCVQSFKCFRATDLQLH